MIFRRRPVVLITRPADDARDLIPAVRAAGFDPVIAPMLSIVPLSPSAPDLHDVCAVVFTSTNAVRHCPVDPPPGVPVFAVGDRTADAARAAGFAPVISAAGDLMAVEEVMAGVGLPPGSRVLHISGADVVRPMALSGLTVDRLVVYRADPVRTFAPSVVRMIHRGRVAGAMVFSARTGQAFVNAIKNSGLEGAAGGISPLCLSDSVVESLSGLSWRGFLTASRPDRAAMIDLLRHLAADARG